MFTIRAPVATYNGISAGVRFTAGVGHTDNPAPLAYFLRVGYTVEWEDAPAVPEPGPVVEIVPSAYEGLTKKQLVALAAERGVEVDERATNAVLRAALIAAASAAETAGTEPAPALGPAVEASSATDPFAPGAEG